MKDYKQSPDENEVVVETSVTVTKLQKLARSKAGTRVTFAIAFFESLLPLPILTEPFLIAAILMDRIRASIFVLVTTIGSVVGGILAYIVAGYFREDLFSLLSVEMVENINSFMVQGSDTFVLTIVGAVTPVPYTVVAWAVALSGGNLLVFIIASVIGRGLRYGIVGWCTYKFGPTALQYARRSLFLTSVIVFLLVGLYLWLKL